MMEAGIHTYTTMYVKVDLLRGAILCPDGGCLYLPPHRACTSDVASTYGMYRMQFIVRGDRANAVYCVYLCSTACCTPLRAVEVRE